MAMGRMKTELVVMADERMTRERWARRPKTARAWARRAGNILACATGFPNTGVPRWVGVTHKPVSKWRAWFVARRLGGLPDEPQPGARWQVSDAEVEEVVTLTRETMPWNAAQWSTRAMAARRGLVQTTIRRIWHALQPHRGETFKLSTDPRFIETVRDIVGLYLAPTDKELVLCGDEKAETQALDGRQPLLPVRPGQVERCTHDYRRRGTTPLFAGKVVRECHGRTRSVALRKFLDRIEVAVPADHAVQLVLDNYGTHKTALIRHWLTKRLRSCVHFMPTSVWLNLVEGWFALLAEKQIRRRVHRSTRESETAIRHHLAVHKEPPKPFVWTKTVERILESVGRSFRRTPGSGHRAR